MIHLLQSAAWMAHFLGCRGATAEGVQILNRARSNNDGLDIDTGDDAICLKTIGALPCRAISVSRCAIKTNCAAPARVKQGLGGERYGGGVVID
jgi:polygalacturonase